MRILRSMMVLTMVAAGFLAAADNNYIGALPGIEVTAPRYRNEDAAWSGLMPAVEVTAPRAVKAETARHEPFQTVPAVLENRTAAKPIAYYQDVHVQTEARTAARQMIPATYTGMTFSGDYHLPLTDTISDDVTITSGNAQIDGVIEGDLAVLGGTVKITGAVTGDVAVMGGNLDLTGSIDGDAAVFGGNIKNRGTISGDLHVIGGTVYLDSASVVDGNISMVGGTVDRDENAIVSGKIDTIEIEALEKILPRISKTFRLPRLVPGFSLFPRIAGLGMLAVLFVLNLLVVLIFPPAIEHIAERIRQSVWASLGLGVALQIVFVPMVVLFAVSIIGIPLIAVLPLAVFAAALFGITALALVVGDRVVRGFGWHVDNRVGRFSLGWLAIMLVPIIVTLIGAPLTVLGVIVGYVVVTIGIGGVIYSLVTIRRKPPAKPSK